MRKQAKKLKNTLKTYYTITDALKTYHIITNELKIICSLFLFDCMIETNAIRF